MAKILFKKENGRYISLAYDDEIADIMQRAYPVGMKLDRNDGSVVEVVRNR